MKEGDGKKLEAGEGVFQEVSGQWLQEMCCETQHSGCSPTMAVLPTITLVVAQNET